MLDKRYGVMHTVFYVMVIAYFVMSFAAIVHSYFRKNQVPRTTIYLLFLTELVAMISFFGGRCSQERLSCFPLRTISGSSCTSSSCIG